MHPVEPDDWYRPRGYLHFDQPISREQAAKVVADPLEVARHSFYPLIGYSISAIKARRDKSRRTITKTSKIREIRYAAHADSHIYSYYNKILSVLYEAEISRLGLEDCVLAFRKLGASNIDFADRAFSQIRLRGDCAAVAFDVTGFFDHIDHQLLKMAWARILNSSKLTEDHYAVFRSLTQYSTVSRTHLYKLLSISPHNPKNMRRRVCSPSEFRDVVRRNGCIGTNSNKYGIPQGTPISALLSNIYLLDFDTNLNALVTSLGGNYFRYCDDILIIIPKVAAEDIKSKVVEQLDKLKLEANPKKTETSQFLVQRDLLTCDRALQYLGFMFDGQRVFLRSAALAKFSGRMTQGVKLAKATARSRNRHRASLGLPEKALYKRLLYERYSHLGRRNFIRYALRAAETMNSNAIRRQLRPLWERLKFAIERDDTGDP